MTLEFKLHTSVKEIGPELWAKWEDPQSPFADYDFLVSLEESGAVGGESGWTPCHLSASIDGQFQAIITLYMKTHSYGEYIFDWGWAEAAERAGIAYYPKLVSAVPFTPASCQKVLLAPEATLATKNELIATAREWSRQQKLSSLHVLFTDESEAASYPTQAWAWRESFQYHWVNKNYQNFDDFLKALKYRKAKQIRRERAGVQSLRIEMTEGDLLSAADGKAFYPYYLSTIEAKQAHAYLPEQFFERAFATMGKRLMIARAFDGERCLAQALYFKKGEALRSLLGGPGAPGLPAL